MWNVILSAVEAENAGDAAWGKNLNAERCLKCFNKNNAFLTIFRQK